MLVPNAVPPFSILLATRAVRALSVLMALVVLGAGHTTRAAKWLSTQQINGFEIRSNFVLSDYPHLVDELTALEQEVTQLLQMPTRGEPIHLLLFADKASYFNYIDDYFPGAPKRRALFIKGSGPGWVMAYASTDFEIDVRHECTHALLHSRLSTVPLWLDEGLAEYFEVAATERRSGNPHRSATRWNAWLYRVPSLRRLETLHDARQMGNTQYRHAWAWIHFLLHGPDPARQVLLDYLQQIAGNARPGMLSDQLEEAVPKLKTSFLTHHRSFR